MFLIKTLFRLDGDKELGDLVLEYISFYNVIFRKVSVDMGSLPGMTHVICPLTSTKIKVTYTGKFIDTAKAGTITLEGLGLVDKWKPSDGVRLPILDRLKIHWVLKYYEWFCQRPPSALQGEQILA